MDRAHNLAEVDRLNIIFFGEMELTDAEKALRVVMAAALAKILLKYYDTIAEFETLIPSIYEDKVLGKIPEAVCVNLLEKYQAEQRTLSAEVKALEARLSAVKKDEHDVEEFIRRLKKYTDVQELTREIALELIEYITVDEYAADRPRDIHIYYKLLEKPLPHKKYLVVDKDEETA